MTSLTWHAAIESEATRTLSLQKTKMLESHHSASGVSSKQTLSSTRFGTRLAPKATLCLVIDDWALNRAVLS